MTLELHQTDGKETQSTNHLMIILPETMLSKPQQSSLNILMYKCLSQIQFQLMEEVTTKLTIVPIYQADQT